MGVLFHFVSARVCVLYSNANIPHGIPRLQEFVLFFLSILVPLEYVASADFAFYIVERCVVTLGDDCCNHHQAQEP